MQQIVVVLGSRMLCRSPILGGENLTQPSFSGAIRRRIHATSVRPRGLYRSQSRIKPLRVSAFPCQGDNCKISSKPLIQNIKNSREIGRLFC
jgi:hypothetical protein